VPAGRRRIDLNFPETALRHAVGCAASLAHEGDGMDRIARPLFRLHCALSVDRARRDDNAAATGGPPLEPHDHSRRGSICASDQLPPPY
jgi:hypothetical protein